MSEQVLEEVITGALACTPVIEGRSKRLFALDEGRVLVQLIPSLSSFTYERHELIDGTQVLRLDFYEMAAARLAAAGVPTAFVERVGPDMYVADLCAELPFETIVKNVAVGSTSRKYPGLFKEGHRFSQPVVKFDFRIDPEDQPLADDYVREAGGDPADFKQIAITVNEVLRSWLAPNDLLDFCLVIGRRADGWAITSEVSPDCMRLKAPDGSSLDKDLFRQGRSPEEIIAVWSDLVRDLRTR